MAISSEIIAKLGLTTEGFSRGLQAAAVQVERFGAEASKTFAKKFSGSDLFRGIFQGIGIASVQQVADRLVAPFKESAESSQRIADYSLQAAESTEKLLAARRNDAIQLEALEKQYERLAAEMQKPAEIGFFRSVAGTAAAMLGLGEVSAKLLTNTQANAEKAAKAGAELAAKGLEIEAKKEQILDKEFEQLIRNYKVRADYVKENRDQVELEAKLLSGRILPAEKARLDVLQQQGKIRENEKKIGEILQKLPEERTIAENQQLTVLFRQREVLASQLEVKTSLVNKTQEHVAAQEMVYRAALKELEVRQQLDQLEGKRRLASEATLFANGKAYGEARDPRVFQQASSAELSELIRRLKLEIGSVEQSKGTGATALADAATGYFIQGSIISRLKTDIQRAQFQLDQRNRIATDRSVLGDEAARRRFAGDPLQYEEILRQQGEGIKDQKRSADGIEEVARLLRTGQARTAAVVMNPSSLPR